VISAALERLRPHPHRGDVIAAGAVPLALAAVLIDLRMRQWSLGPRFVVLALISALILTMGLLAPLEYPSPRSYHSVLLVAGLIPFVFALVALAELLGARRPPGAGGVAWTLAVEGAIAAFAARRSNSAACTLVAAIAGAIAVEAFVAWVFRPVGLGTFRAVLVALTAALAVGAVRLRDRQRCHAVALVNAAGLTALAVAASYLYTLAIPSLLHVSGWVAYAPEQQGVPFGWKLYLIAVGFGLAAYGAVDRERGPAYLAVAVLGAFAVLTGPPSGARGTLVGWPLLLLVIGGAGLAIGLRPRRPLPPEPGTAEAPPAIPIDPEDRGGTR
jgi:hypothetical protein